MKVTRLDAENVHGYLPIHIDFAEDLTFLTGLNGSGKTSALRLLMGLLAPNINELISITFSTVSVTVSINLAATVLVEAVRSSDGLVLSTSQSTEKLSLSTAELQLLTESKFNGDEKTPLHQKISAHPVFSSIEAMSTPMFLGLDRKLRLESRGYSSWKERRELDYRRTRAGFAHYPSNDGVLGEVNELVILALSEIRAAQERLDETLRNQILLDSFRYEPTTRSLGGLPSRAALNNFRERQAGIENAAAGLKLPIGEVQSALSDFFEKMTQIVDVMEAQTKAKSGEKKSKKTKPPEPPPDIVLQWVMNNRQANRIFKQIELLDDYVTKRGRLHEPIDRFLQLTNGFLKQTNKTIFVSERGNLRVKFKTSELLRGLVALSSGERQLVVMIAHLSLNKRLAESGVFIVDEPELSLHLGWQEQFVEAIQKANPNVQLILATHSPAIILDRTANCRSLS